MMRNRLMRKFFVVALLLQLVAPARGVALSFDAQGEPAGWTPELMITKVKGVGASATPPGAVRVSPDGRRVAYTVTTPLMTADKSEYVSQIYVANADGSDNFQATYAEKTSTNPHWSPDSKWLAFTSTRSGKNNLYLLRLNGGEAEQLTDVKTGVQSFGWSPDGRSIAFTMSDQPVEDEEKATKGKDDWHWVDETIKMSRLYVVAVQKDAAGKREPRKLTTENYNVGGDFDWSPDSKTIAFSHTKAPKADYWTTSDVSIVDVSSGALSKLLTTPAAESQPIFSPDGRTLAVTVTENPPRWTFASTIQLLPVGGSGPLKSLAATFDAQPNLIGWTADGKQIYFSEARGTGTRIYAVNANTNSVAEVNKTVGVLTGLDLNQSHTMLGFTMQTADTPPEAYVSRLDNFAPVQVSRANADIPRLPLGKTEVITWKSADGKEIEGLLTYPVGYTQGKRVPLILNVHGGPSGVFQQTFIASRGAYPIAAFAAHGYAVLRPNPRGSSGYGSEFRRANVKDWGGGDYQDLMTGVDHVIQMGVADPERLGVMGWSYGGFMTSWIITQTHRFKAASAGAPVTNLMSFTGTADIPSFIPDYFGGQPWEAMDIYRAHSPMFNVKGVTTPTMIQHGEADDRVPISQGFELYNALKAQGVPARMLTLPRQPHGPNEPKMLLKVMQANLEWFDKYIGGASTQSANK